MARLVITAGKGEGRTREVARPTILGRMKGVDLVVEDIGASREHCKVYQQDGDWFVIDLNSRNGTKVNGTPVTRWRLKDGDRIGIGATLVTFQAPELAARAAAAPAPASPAAPAPSVPPASPAAPAAPRGPSVIERERERLRAAEAERKPQGARARADDGSGIVIKETVLQYGRREDRGGLLAEDLGQRGPLFKLGLYAVLGAVFLGIVWGIAKALDRPPPDESLPEDAPAETGGR